MKTHTAKSCWAYEHVTLEYAERISRRDVRHPKASGGFACCGVGVWISGDRRLRGV